MKKAYICSPFQARTEIELDRNIDYAQALTKKALRDGFAPIAPHLYFTQCLDNKNPYERKMGLDAGLELLKFCDVIIVGLAYGLREDMDVSVKAAIKAGLEVIEC